MQAEGFTIIEGTNEAAAAAAAAPTQQLIENTTTPTMPEDEIAWETVESAAPAAEASSLAAPGDHSAVSALLHLVLQGERSYLSFAGNTYTCICSRLRFFALC